MPQFGKKSKERLATCDPCLQEICNEAIKVFDFTVLEGHRDEEMQNKLYSEGKSKLRYPDSKHNTSPSKAIDIIPYPIDWQDTERFARLAGLIFGIAHSKGINLRWGGTWKGLDGGLADFADMPHFEIAE